jgi:hypothetical protein
MSEPHKRNRHPRYRTGYRIKNWAEYEAALRQRGSITFWLNNDVIAGWKPPQNGKRGAQAEYSDLAIQTCIALRLLFHQPLRQTEGFVASIFEMMNMPLSVPDHTTLSRRRCGAIGPPRRGRWRMLSTTNPSNWRQGNG